jgi:hypothetical protein
MMMVIVVVMIVVVMIVIVMIVVVVMMPVGRGNVGAALRIERRLDRDGLGAKPRQQRLGRGVAPHPQTVWERAAPAGDGRPDARRAAPAR